MRCWTQIHMVHHLILITVWVMKGLIWSWQNWKMRCRSCCRWAESQTDPWDSLWLTAEPKPHFHLSCVQLSWDLLVWKGYSENYISWWNKGKTPKPKNSANARPQGHRRRTLSRVSVTDRHAPATRYDTMLEKHLFVALLQTLTFPSKVVPLCVFLNKENLTVALQLVKFRQS